MTNINNNDERGEDDEDDIQYGYRRSRRRTWYKYRGSSSLTPAQMMEKETHYRYAEVAVQHVTYILQLILFHQASYVSLCASITRWSGIASMARAVAIAREKVEKTMAAVNRLLLLVRWIQAHNEVALLYAEDLTVFVFRRYWITPRRFRRIEDVLHQDCYTWFGHYPHKSILPLSTLEGSPDIRCYIRENIRGRRVLSGIFVPSLQGYTIY